MSKYIDADKLKRHYAWWDDESKKIFDEIIDLQPAADVAPRWIPVTERLPEKGSYLCTENHLGTIFIDVSYFDGKQWCLPNGNPHFVTEVIAWMPLPEPYKGGEEE